MTNRFYIPTPYSIADEEDHGGYMENPIPGQFHRRVHGSRVVHELLGWCNALKQGDQQAAARLGNELLKAAHTEGADSTTTTALMESMQAAVHACTPPAPAGGGHGGAQASAENSFDLKQPDPNFFYVLDKQSGAQLEEVRIDLLNLDRYISRGAPAPSRLLFEGPPGTGKTVGGLWIGSKINMPVALVRIDATVGSAVGATAKNLRAAFEYARDNSAIVFIDEFEAVAVPRSNQSGNVGQWSRETTSALLQLLDSLPPEQIVIGATNHMDLIDGAVRDRMWTHVRFVPPDRDTRAAMLRQWWATAPHDGAAKKALLDMTEGLAGRQLKAIADAANRSAARRGLVVAITQQDVQLAVLRLLATADAQQVKQVQTEGVGGHAP